MITGAVSVFEDGKPSARWTPAKWFFNKHEQEPTTEVAIRRAPAQDLYIVLAGYDVATQSATYAVTINPLVDWIWLGFARAGAWHGIALLPERAFAFAAAQRASRCGHDRADDPAAAAAGSRAGASDADATPAPKRALRKQLEKRSDVHLRRMPGTDERLPDAAGLSRLS